MSVYLLTRRERIAILCSGLVMLAIGLWLWRDARALMIMLPTFGVLLILRGTVLRPKK